MQEYGTVDCGLWEHYAFLNLSDVEQKIFLYLKTCRHMNGAGCFFLPLPYINAVLREPLTPWLTPQEGHCNGLPHPLDTLSRTGFVRYCPTTQWVLLPGHMRFFPPRGRNQIKHVIGIINQVPGAFSHRAELVAIFLAEHNFGRESPGDLGGAINAVASPYGSPPYSTTTTTPTTTTEPGARPQAARPGSSARPMSYRLPGRGEVKLPPLSPLGDAERRALCTELGLHTRGHSREELNEKIRRALEAAGAAPAA